MLKSDIHDPTWFFDLEWVPDAAGIARVYELPAETTELEAMERLWQDTKGYDPETCPRPFVKYLFSRVVSIAFLSRRVAYRDGQRHIEFGLHSLPKLPITEGARDEAQLISQFLHFVGFRNPQLVGYNSLDSDLQVLIQRGLINEVRAEAFSERPNRPWEGRDYFDSRNSEAHLDLMQKLSRNSMTPRLNDLAKLCGFPGKIDIDGKQVVDLWLNGDLRSIVEYNQIDTLNTYLVWLRVVNFAGKISEEEYITEHDDFRSFLETESDKEDRGHLRRFLDKWEI